METLSTGRQKYYRDFSWTFHKGKFKCSNFPNKEWGVIFLIRAFDGSRYSANQINSSMIVVVILKANNKK